MSLYLTRGKYSPEGWKGLVAKPEDRAAAVRGFYEAAGVKLHQLWFSTCTGDAIAVCEANQAAIGSLFGALGASGVFVDGTIEELMTPGQHLEAMKGAANIVSKYRAPGK